MAKKIVSMLKNTIHSGVIAIRECFSSPQLLSIVIFSCLFLGIISLFDKTLAVGVILIAFLVAITFWILKKAGFEAKTIYKLFLIILFIHLGLVLFIHYANFQPFSGGAGDYSEYDVIAQQISERVQQGNFSLKGIDYGHFYPVIVGYIYTLTLPKALIGQMFNAWLVALLVVFIYLTVLEMGGSEKGAFLAGLAAGVYPSLLFFGSLLVKDALVALVCSIVLFLTLRLLRDFSWPRFLILYIFLGALSHFRLYIAFAAMLALVISWFLFSNLEMKKRLIYGVIIIFLLGFLPNYSGGQGSGQGYYGINFLKIFVTRGVITEYRELLSIPNPKTSPVTGLAIYDEPSTVQPPAPKPSTVQPTTVQPPAPKPTTVQPPAPKPSTVQPTTPEPTAVQPPIKRGRGSNVTVKTGFENPFTFVKNSLISFIYASFGPFPWQIRYLRQTLVLPETILWYFALFFAIKGINPKRPRAFALFIFSFIVLGSISVYLANFGITTRIRIPAFLSVFCLAPFGINWASNNKIFRFFSKSLDVLMRT